MLTLHIANKNYSSWSLRPWLLMTELSIPFTEKLSAFSEGSNWDEFRTFSPTGLVPCLVDGERAIWDSLAITEYLAEQHPQVWPSDVDARAWARCASAEMHSGFAALRDQCSMNCGISVTLHAVTDALQKDISRLDELWNQGLTHYAGPFLAGSQFTAVDAFYAPVAFRVRNYGLTMSDNALAYVDRLLELAPVKAWEAAALKETWREPGHEQDCVQYGTLTEDFRQA